MRATSANSGFTLIELLVVLVILSLTTTLLSEALNTTWANFSRLNSATSASANNHLARHWFVDSFQGAVMYHPEKPNVYGQREFFAFVTFKSISNDDGIPENVRWFAQRSEAGNGWGLFFENTLQNGNAIEIATFPNPVRFEYFDGQQWSQTFQPKAARIPTAVRILVGDNVWAMASAPRPELADYPTDLAEFGELSI